ncbi:unnamed protein product [Parnassius mnemosyne]|uniref:THAP-type domain-containing protein n=1 Tax=Parnassius mnemosyne TaxID=213953 RepID=A0AAV1KQB8_9NEOP
MPVCVVTLCKNNTTRNKKDTGTTYHQFPADPVILDRWTAIVRLSRQESWWKPGKRSVICSAHFNESDLYFTNGGLKRLCKGAVPQNALFLSSTPSDISNNSTVTTEPSIPVPVVSSTNSAVTGEQSRSVLVFNETILANGNETPPLDDFPDIDYIFDTPREIKLKKELNKKTVLQLKHARIIKTLREKTRRLRKSNCNLKNIIKSLKQELNKKTVLQLKHARIIKTLCEKTLRLRKANCNLNNIIKSLKQERL